MARIQRLYRVLGTWPDGSTKVRHYQGPEAAEERRLRWLHEYSPHDGEDGTQPALSVVVTASHPVSYPHPAGDPTPMDIPDTLVDRATVDSFLLTLGILPAAVQVIMFSSAEVVVEYQPDPTGKREPKLWRASITENE